MKTALHFGISLIFIILICLSNTSYSQTEPDIGEDIHICFGSTDSIDLIIKNLDSLSIGNDTPFVYHWLLQEEGGFVVIAEGVVTSMSSIPNHKLCLAGVKNTSQLRFTISDLGFNNELFADKMIIVQRPEIIMSTPNIVCENNKLTITANPCNLTDLGPNTYSFIYNDPSAANYLTLLEGTTEWMSSNEVIYYSPDLTDISGDLIVKFKVLVKNSIGEIQESETISFKVLNIGRPSIASKLPLCDESINVSMELNGVDENNLNFRWLIFNQDSGRFETISGEESRTLNITYTGQYLGMVYRIVDSVNSCGKLTNLLTVDNLVVPIINSSNTVLSPSNPTITLNQISAIEEGYVHWYKDGQLVMEGGQSFTATNPGSYYALSIDNCSQESNFINLTYEEDDDDELTNLKLNSKNSNIVSAFPNPFNNNLFLNINNSNYSSFIIEVFDIYGQVTKSIQTYSNIIVQIDFSFYNDGVYFINVKDLNSSVSQTIKVVKINY
jgi:hypothetical protein